MRKNKLHLAGKKLKKIRRERGERWSKQVANEIDSVIHEKITVFCDYLSYWAPRARAYGGNTLASSGQA